MMKELMQARACLSDLTPLSMDCGALCGAACCQEDTDRQVGGMLLFPGEEALYVHDPAFSVEPLSWQNTPFPQPMLLRCQGHCCREDRPLACRIFPLVPLFKEEKLVLRMDPGASGVCPLYDSGRQGLMKPFVDQVRRAMKAIAQVPEGRAHILGLTWLYDQARHWL